MNPETSKALHGLMGVVIGLVFGFIMGVVLGSSVMGQFQREAIQKGFAEYALVNGGPNTKFQWKEPKP